MLFKGNYIPISLGDSIIPDKIYCITKEDQFYEFIFGSFENNRPIKTGLLKEEDYPDEVNILSALHFYKTKNGLLAINGLIDSLKILKENMEKDLEVENYDPDNDI